MEEIDNVASNRSVNNIGHRHEQEEEEEEEARQYVRLYENIKSVVLDTCQMLHTAF
jgi:hypothetical protein